MTIPSDLDMDEGEMMTAVCAWLDMGEGWRVVKYGTESEYIHVLNVESGNVFKIEVTKVK